MNSRWFRLTGVAATFLALFFMLGGHWFALQSFAWTRMLAEFSKTDSFSEAVSKTFDGKHPCKMCLRIREGRQQEDHEQQKLPLLKTENLPELFCDSGMIEVPLAPVAEMISAGFVPQPHTDFVETPPSPPPRFLLAVL